MVGNLYRSEYSNILTGSEGSQRGLRVIADWMIVEKMSFKLESSANFVFNVQNFNGIER